jgi:hypothetical protein
MPEGCFRRLWTLVAGVVVLVSLAAGPVQAHHGRDFLLSQTAELPHPGQLFLIPRQDYVEADEGEIEFEPTLLFGATERLALEVHGHVAKEGGGDFEYESTAPAFHLLLTTPHASWGLALSGEYEFSHVGGEEAHAEEPEEHGTDESDEPAHEGVDRAEARLVFSIRRADRLVALNLIASEAQTSGADVEWAYSAGFRSDLREGVAWGIEAQGDLESDAAHEALVGLYFEPSQRWTVNAGVGTGIGDDAPDLTVRTAVVFRLR